MKPRRLWLGPPGFHTKTQKLQTCTFQGSRPSKTPPRFNEKTPREKEKERNFARSGGGGVRRRGEGVQRRVVWRRVVWRRVVQGDSKPTTTTTTIKWGALKGGAPNCRAPSPPVYCLGCRVWGFRSECRSLGFWVLGFLGSQNLAKTQKKKLATVKLATVGLAKVCHDHPGGQCSTHFDESSELSDTDSVAPAHVLESDTASLYSDDPVEGAWNHRV